MSKKSPTKPLVERPVRAGTPVAVTQDPLTVKIAAAGGVVRATYSLDGKEVAHKVAEIGGGQNPRMKLPTPGTEEIHKTTLATEARFIEGQWMVVETVRKTPTGDVTRTTCWKRVPKFEDLQ